MSKPQIIEYNGTPTHVILTIDEYETLQSSFDDLADLQAFDAAISKPSFPDAVAERLIDGENPARVFRTFRGLTLAQMAQKTGLSSPYISKIESGKGGSVRAYKKIAEALGVTVDDLVE